MKKKRHVDPTKPSFEAHRTHQAERCSIESLTEGILTSILAQLDHCHQFRIQRVCKLWLKCSREAISSAQSICIAKSFPQLLDDNMIRKLLSKSFSSQSLRACILRSLPLLSDRTLKYLTESLTSLTKLELSHCCNISDSGMKALSRLPLEELTLSHTSVTDAGLESLLLQLSNTLRYLDISASVKLGTGELFHILKNNCLKLEFLDVSRCIGIKEHILSLLPAITSLQVLRMAWPRYLTAAGAVRMCSVTPSANLTELDLSGATNMSDDAAEALSRTFSSLRTLKLGFCCNISPRGFTYLSCLKQLTCLSVEFTQFDRSSLASLEPLSKLVRIHLTGTPYTKQPTNNKHVGMQVLDNLV